MKDSLRLRLCWRQRGQSRSTFFISSNTVLLMRYSFSEMQRRTGLLQRHLIEEMGSHMAVICKAKGHAEQALKGLRASVESPGP
jgi:hypothetical protein